MTIITIAIEIAAILLLLYGYTQEDRIVAWEQTKKAEAFAWINRRIAAYERRRRHG